MLTEQQIETFKKEGVLIIENFFASEEIAVWKGEVCQYFHQPISDMDWFRALQQYNSSDFEFSNEPSPANHYKMGLLYCCLNNHIKWDGDNDLVLRYPDLEAKWLGARAPHLDFPVYDEIRTLANSVFYLNDVNSYGSPFMYWPGSHLLAWDYFKENPQDYMTQGELSQDNIFEKITSLMTREAIPFTGKAGDLMIWDSMLLHSPSVNKSKETRMAIIGRWGQNLQDPSEKRFDFNMDKWTHWNFNAIDEKIIV